MKETKLLKINILIDQTNDGNRIQINNYCEAW